MGRIILFFFLILSLFVTEGCKKDKNDYYNCECYDFGNTINSSISTYISHGRFQYKSPFFNPKNENEIVFNFYDFELNTFQIIKYNLASHQRTTLSSDVKIISQPKWSTKGWIAFDNLLNSNYQIGIVKDNGDSLNGFTEITANLFPAWNNQGDKLVWQFSPVLGIPYYLLEKHLNTHLVDTLSGPNDITGGYSSFNDISEDNILYSLIYINGKRHIGRSMLDSISFSSVFPFEEFGLDGLNGITVDGEYVYFSAHGEEKSGLYRINIDDLSFQRIITFCDSKYYKHISISPDGTKLIGERVDSYPKKNSDGNFTGEIVENSNIYLIDLQTIKETKINF